ncbi:MAG: DUF1735 domain-containing protein [Tannerella sp.]|jgi:hypothetical protein|nr:DUF1735 domain-containing protein [Tannerella sp.]
MKNSFLKNRCFNRSAICFVAGILLLVCSCGKLDYEGKEFWRQEVYIINSESTAASERLVSNILAYTFNDTLRIINDDYDTELIEDNNPGVTYVKYKIGIGGSLPAHENIIVKVGFDEETVNDYNIERNEDFYIPDASLFTANVPWDGAAQAYTVEIPEGSSSASLILTVPILRDKTEEYERFAFPVKILSCEQAPLSRLYTKFMVAGFVITTERTTDWSGFPIPKLPEGRYYSTLLQSNGAENTQNGFHRKYKYIMRQGNEPEYENKYVVWGTSIWSAEVSGLHGMGWMYNTLELNDQVRGTYTHAPIVAGVDWPANTFTFTSLRQKATENSKYDPKTKTLTLYYKDIPAGGDQVDILTYMGDEEVYGPGYTQWTWPSPSGSNAPILNWQQVRSRGYKRWLPIDEE